MLPSKYRLKERSSFAQVELQGTMFQFPSFGVGVLKRGDNGPTLFGFVISTKISKKAVTRNKIKRILSEAVRINYKDVKSGLDVVFLVKPSILNKDTKVITNEVEKALKHASIIL